MRALLQLTLSCVVLGAGVALLLTAELGSDGYSTLVSGLALASGLPFWSVNVCLGVVLIALAWTRGVRPGPGTVVQPVVVGLTVSALLAAAATPEDAVVRAVLAALALPVLALGVAGYLAVEAGAGPAEAAGQAFDPPVPFGWSYTVLQVGGALVGWACGAAVGPGTVLVALTIGPIVDLLRPRLPQPRLRPAAPAPRR
ncbi:hypothetical protein GCM10022215_35940 [Nocardioides fonticola]|uniref:Integral membrane protein n=1 Tax=Nocardioides fonticola TaxID=450363 RepID=A0ABP7XV33_9ACTN